MFVSISHHFLTLLKTQVMKKKNTRTTLIVFNKCKRNTDNINRQSNF